MITCVHTAEVHVETFSGLIGDARHIVRADLLDRAREGGVEAVANDVNTLLSTLAGDGPVLCTCSTLGPLVDMLGNQRVLRVDRPAMAAAAAIPGEALLAVCLDSTRQATGDLFDAIAGPGRSRILLCDTAWPLFEAGDMAGFAQVIAARVRAELGGATSVVLAQASMAVAAPLLEDLGVPVLTTPALAAKAVQALA